MDLYLSRSSHLNTILSDAEGRAFYRIHTPGLFLRKTTMIYRISPDAALKYKEELAKGKDVGDDWDLGAEEFARIHWHIFKTSRLIFNGIIHEIEDFMPARGIMSL